MRLQCLAHGTHIFDLFFLIKSGKIKQKGALDTCCCSYAYVYQVSTVNSRFIILSQVQHSVPKFESRTLNADGFQASLCFSSFFSQRSARSKGRFNSSRSVGPRFDPHVRRKLFTLFRMNLVGYLISSSEQSPLPMS